MEKLYAEYGDLMIKLEILNGRIGDVKKRIADELNKLASAEKTCPEE